MTDEESFRAAIQADPTDDLLRQVYADWLDDHDRPGGDFLRLECDLHAQDLARNPHEPLILPDDFTASSRRIDHAQLAALSRVPIELCGDERAFLFAFKCPKRWESLPVNAETPGVRHCDDCRKDVHFCSNKEQAYAQAALGRCIALSLPLVDLRGTLEPREPFAGMTMGIVAIPDDDREPPKPWFDPRGWFT